MDTSFGIALLILFTLISISTFLILRESRLPKKALPVEFNELQRNGANREFGDEEIDERRVRVRGGDGRAGRAANRLRANLRRLRDINAAHDDRVNDNHRLNRDFEDENGENSSESESDDEEWDEGERGLAVGAAANARHPRRRGEGAAAAAARQGVRDAKRAKQDERRLAKEAYYAAKDAADEKAKEEERRIADEKLSKWKTFISIEDSGMDGHEHFDDPCKNENLMTRFVSYIERRKSVPLDELAREFETRISDVIQRIKTLEAQGRLSGVFDERGKFVYVSEVEMKAVAEFIRSRGRVTVADLARRSNVLVDLVSGEVEGDAGAEGKVDRKLMDFESLLY
uniref:DDRGK domain-containing protein 1 n=1 Tax=Polytomella parva TaxID=51329 RepID=A0A7S0URE2_9CHLO|mmetsp:Transcript_18831/g.34155  ORF Transcript_18831/g.34155 Transcript_18831/m.34155 type:complete len:343 (+) Transcript_18831:160-1188(+)|eukprot:CAMPEP_0175064710 /NCGR_PEP_ID=MMETSP0052_2-20121109/15496_1 /TAXON_ID=51329 ORGANISM="Polytomella parva, Strain SAG 63-3" /NCGR_SAMPLE_ID=MMETSP0052_2 /ASSEMBLY_ACC=CAM_ASM_000194 /LENGTH=342 /DNA_ID=CAMNT_0016331115 /DNA_START=63 /DNA_END=1091 /DNA_ORIENTATION=-